MNIEILTPERVELAAKLAARSLRRSGPYHSEPIDSVARELAADALEQFASYITYSMEDLRSREVELDGRW